jgi:ribonucleoside-diphosphate reductase alpha chain
VARSSPTSRWPPLRAELLEHPLRDAHRAAHLGDVLAHDEDVLVAAHRRRQRVAPRLAVREHRHQFAHEPVTRAVTDRPSSATSPVAAPSTAEQAASPARRANRGRGLPAERTAVTHKFDIAGHEGYITVGLYPDGQPGEIFLKMAKEGSTVSGLMDSFATTVSVALIAPT